MILIFQEFSHHLRSIDHIRERIADTEILFKKFLVNLHLDDDLENLKEEMLEIKETLHSLRVKDASVLVSDAIDEEHSHLLDFIRQSHESNVALRIWWTKFTSNDSESSSPHLLLIS